MKQWEELSLQHSIPYTTPPQTTLNPYVRWYGLSFIEKVGGDGRKVEKEQMKGTSYSMGRVYFQEDRVTGWDDGTGILVLKGGGKDFEEGYKKPPGME